MAEAGTLEWQALLLTQSIRLFLPPSEAAITVVSPRPDRRPSPSTIAQLHQLQAEYLPLMVRSPCPHYGTSYKLAALVEAECRPGPCQLVMLDSDTLFLARPYFDTDNGGVGLRPVDMKGMCTSGPDDPFDQYWRKLCAICEVHYEDIPWVESMIDSRRVKASHNGGLVAVDRQHGLFARSFDFLSRSIAENLYPRAATGNKPFRIGAGEAHPEAGRLWGSAQAALSLAIVSLKLQARLLKPVYNIPLHHFDRMAQRFPDVRTNAVHGHYHWLFRNETAKNPLLNGDVVVPPRVKALIDSAVRVLPEMPTSLA